jgi:hypothetical protein
MGIHGDMVVEARYDEGVNHPEAALEVGPPPLDYDEAGVDLSLIRWSISLTPFERLASAEELINEILAIRERNAKR